MVCRYYVILREISTSRKMVYSQFKGLCVRHYMIYGCGCLLWPVLFPVYIVGCSADLAGRYLPCSRWLMPVTLLLLIIDIIHLQMIKIYL